METLCFQRFFQGGKADLKACASKSASKNCFFRYSATIHAYTPMLRLLLSNENSCFRCILYT